MFFKGKYQHLASSSLLESMENGEVETTFQGYDVFSWNNKLAHVFVFSNTAPQYNFLSPDRLLVYEVLPEDYKFNLRPAILRPIMMYQDGYNIQYRYISFHANRASELDSSSPAILYNNYEKEYLPSKNSKIKECNILNYIGRSAPITQSSYQIPENIRNYFYKKM